MTDDLGAKISEFEDEVGAAVLVSEDKELVVDVGINLSGGNIGVPEQFLDHPQVGSVLEEVGGEGVA